MSIRPTDLKESAYEPSETSNLTESEIKKEEVKKKYLFILLFLIIDYLITISIILDDSNIFRDLDNINYVNLLVSGICLTAFYLFILISLILYRVCLAKIIKYLFIVLIGGYFFYLLIMKIIHFVNDFSDLGYLDFIFVSLLLVSLAPKVLFFFFFFFYIVRLVEKYECQKGEEHEEFRQNLENKMGRGDDTNWSKTSMPSEPRISN